MAYSPIEQGRLLRDRVLTAVAIRHRATTAQIALAWALRQPDMMVIPKAATLEHVRESRTALNVRLNHQDLAELDSAFPPPKRPRPLEVMSARAFGPALRNLTPANDHEPDAKVRGRLTRQALARPVQASQITASMVAWSRAVRSPVSQKSFVL